MELGQQDVVNKEKLSGSDMFTKRLAGMHAEKLAFLSGLVNALRTTAFTGWNWRRKEVKAIPEGVGILQEMVAGWEQLPHDNIRKIDEFFNRVSAQLVHSRALDGGDQATEITSAFYQDQIAAMEVVLKGGKKEYRL